MQNYSEIIFELINENKAEAAKSTNDLAVLKHAGKYGLKKEIYEIKTQHQENLLKKNKGKYTLVSFLKLHSASKEEKVYLINYLSNVLVQYLNEKEKINNSTKILVVALGNRHIKSDSLGTETIKNVIVSSLCGNMINNATMPKIYTFATSVYGLTGIESKNIIEGIINEIKPDKLIVIDTYCANNYKRLGTNFQINNGGIIPGSGIGNSRKTINKKNMKIDVIPIGVPLVVYASSFISNAINEVEYNNENKELINFIEDLSLIDFNNLILTVSEIEDVVKLCGRIIGYAINKSILKLDVSQQEDFFNNL